ncbi:MAG TPA: ABC transporter substrate-binding protein, partial [Anaerolineales bacterium]|nr:ABC transporter substrate-binding protein [Anaerolineales bacterium]
AQKEPIRIAISAWAGVEPAELASQLGYYEKHGVEVEMVRFSAYSDSIEALVDGNVDAGMHTLDDAIRYFSTGRDVRVVLLTDYSFGGDGLVARSGIETLEDLRGKKIGVEIGTVGHLSLLKILKLAGFDIEDVSVISIPAWEIQQAMINGEIDAGVTWEPYLTSTANTMGGKVLITSRDYPETIITTMTIDAEIIKTRPEDVQKVVAAYFEAVEYMKQNPQDAYERMGLAEGVSASEFESHVNGIQYLDLASNLDLFGKDGEGRAYTQTELISNFLFDQHVIDTLPDIRQLLQPDFIRAMGG